MIRRVFRELDGWEGIKLLAVAVIAGTVGVLHVLWCVWIGGTNNPGPWLWGVHAALFPALCLLCYVLREVVKGNPIRSAPAGFWRECVAFLKPPYFWQQP